MHRPRLRALLVLVPLVLACNLRAPVQPDPGDGGVLPTPDSAKVPPDARVLPPADATVLPDGALPLDGSQPLCKNPGPATTRHNDPARNMTLVLPSTAQASWAGIANPVKGEAAVAIQLDKVSAAVVSFPAGSYSRDAQARLELLRIKISADLTTSGLGKLTVLGSGTGGMSREGNPDLKEASWLVEPQKAQAPSTLRNFIISSTLNRTHAQLTGLPLLLAHESTALLIRATLEARLGQFVLSVAVANQTHYKDGADGTFAQVEDLSNGSAVASFGRLDAFYCDVGPIAKRPEADIIWVMDESGSMNDNRYDIVRNAATLYAKAKAAGLDFRMGVTGVKAPGANVLPGKFCSKATTDKYDDGGTDRFLTQGEKATFDACVTNPPYYEGGKEFGLSNLYEGIIRHLPRKANDPAKIRPKAHLAVIVATDETPQELKPGGFFLGKDGFLDYLDYQGTTCTLSKEKQAKVNELIKPIIDLVTGKTNAEGKATVHLLGGLCNNGCKAEQSHGYAELVKATSGQMGDVCQPNLGSTLQLIINSISAVASPRTLRNVPISATLTVEVQGVPLARSRVHGYMYNAAGNSLTFNKVLIKPGHTVVAGYRRFK